MLTCELPVLKTLPVPCHTPQHLPGHWLHASIHLLIFAIAGGLHCSLKESIDLLKVHPLKIKDQLSLFCRAQLIPELQEVRLVSFRQLLGNSTGSCVHDQR